METSFAARVLGSAAGSHWRRIGTGKRAGVLVPLFSVFSKESVGAGDLADMRPLLDWCRRTGHSILQLLPMNEMGDIPCPYDAASSFALEPMYLPLQKRQGQLDRELVRKRAEMSRLFPTKTPRVDYRLRQARRDFLRAVYVSQGDAGAEERDAFRQQNSYWIEDFALYKVLRRVHGAPWHEWPEEFRERRKDALADFSVRHREELDFEVWLQWRLREEFRAVREHADSLGILLMGDMPLLVSKDSADVWAHRGLFHLEFCAGAPPDAYSVRGQRWGMPTYRWDAVAADGYRYLKERLRYAQQFYHMVRIDHVLGLFRLWTIPREDAPENQGLNGFFDPADERMWEGRAREILRTMIDGTDMLVCAEDLGAVPKACPRLLEEMGVPGNDVQRWAKDWEVRHDFLGPGEYRECAISLLSNHDMTPWAEWWETEAGTVDEEFFRRHCGDLGIDAERLFPLLFEPARAVEGRLRWKPDVASTGEFLSRIGRNPDGAGLLVAAYENSFAEKEKFWKALGAHGPVPEKASPDLVRRAVGRCLAARSIFSIQSVFDWLSAVGILQRPWARYRVNRPGTVGPDNWSARVPVPLETMADASLCRDIRVAVEESGRTSREGKGR